jgi:acyl dehydratase
MTAEPATAVSGAEGLRSLVGVALPPTAWTAMSRERHLAFDAANDHTVSTNYEGGATAGWIHGGHTLSLALTLFEQQVAVRGFGRVVLYGLDRVRFPAGVPIGARVRGRFVVRDVAAVAGGVQCRVEARVELEEQERPALAADLLLRMMVNGPPA